MKYNVNISIEAENKEQAAEKMNAFAVISQNISHNELIDLTEAIRVNPKIVPFIRKVVSQIPKDKEDIGLVTITRIVSQNWTELKSILK
jgi:hypothetical protein